MYDRRVDWFQWTEDGYTALTPEASGVIHSRMFPGLQLAVPALLQGDMAQVLATLQKGLGTAEHQTFAARLAEGRSAEQ